MIAVREPFAAHRTALAHEVFHAVVRQSGLRPPPGLEEGLAEYFSTASETSDGRMVLGATAQARLRRLQSLERFGIRQTIDWQGATGESLRAGAPENSGNYDLAWAAAHWLLQASGASVSDAGAWLTPGPAVIARLEAELPQWIRKGMASTTLVSAVSFVPMLASEPAPLGIRESAMIRILMQCGRYAAAERTADSLRAGGVVDGGLVHAALGRLAVKMARYDEGARELQLAIQQGVDDVSTWRQLAYAESSQGHQAAVAAALEHVLAYDPGDDESRLVRASILLWMGEQEKGLAELTRVEHAPKGHEEAYTQLMARNSAQIEARNGAVFAQRNGNVQNPQ
jgi:tetratricopeptide (TPR) repeat protein